MMYIQLSMPYRNFDKVKIKTMYFDDSVITIKYCVYNNSSILFEKSLNIFGDDLEKIINSNPVVNFSVIENMQKNILEYMIEKNIETGTLEVK